MKKIFELLSEIRPADQKAMEAARLRWNSVAKPIGSLGILEEDIIKIAGILGEHGVSIEQVYQKKSVDGISELVIITDLVQEKHFDDALGELEQMAVMKEISGVIRVYG